MRLHACVMMLLLVGSSVAVAVDCEADHPVAVDSGADLVAMRALVPADEIGGYDAFHLAVTLHVGPHLLTGWLLDIQDVKEEQEHFGSGEGRITYDDAVADWEARARDGDPDAMSNLAVMYDLGLGVAPDPARAVELYRSAAGRGSAVAGNNLGIAYFLGRGVERDKARAIQWLVAAGRAGLSLAKNTLGVWQLLAGHERSGVEWLLRAVKKQRSGVFWLGGFGAAERNLARLYEAKADDVGFDEWFWNTAVATATGWPPVPAEPLAAYHWFDRAARAGFPAAARKRDLADAAERASTARWSAALFSAPGHVLREEKELLERIGGSMCHNYSYHGNFSRIEKMVRRAGERTIGREVPFERAYMYVQCYHILGSDNDFLRTTVWDPLNTKWAAHGLVHYFTDVLKDKFLLGKILMCRRDRNRSGDGVYVGRCLNVFDEVEGVRRISRTNQSAQIFQETSARECRQGALETPPWPLQGVPQGGGALRELT